MKNSLFNKFFVLVLLLTAGTFQLSAQKPGFTFDQTGRWNPIFPVDFEKGLFRTTMDVMGHHMSGLTLIKRTSDTSFRINFSNEVGMTFFDFEINDRDMKVLAIFPDMDRKSLISLLENDFRMMLFRDRTIKSMDTQDNCGADSVIIHHVISGRGKYTYTVQCKSLKLKNIGSMKKGFKRTYLEFQYGESPVPVKTIITNPSVKLNLTLGFLGN